MNSKLESRDATIIIGWYTFVLHLLSAFYFLDVYRGSSSDWVPSPLFEYSTDTMYTLAIILAIYSLSFMVTGSLGLIWGVKTETRIYYFPWLILTAFETAFLYYQVCFVAWKYSYDADTNLLAIIILVFAIYHTYLYLIVLSNYRYLKRIQNPTLIFPQEA